MNTLIFRRYFKAYNFQIVSPHTSGANYFVVIPERLTANTTDRSALMATTFSTNLLLTEKRQKK